MDTRTQLNHFAGGERRAITNNFWAWYIVRAALVFLFLLMSGAATSPIRHGEKAPGGGLVKSGTGFFVSHDGVVATSAHVVSGCSEITIWPADRPERVARIVASDAKRDLALLLAGGEVEWYANRVHEIGSLHSGEPVSTIGFGVLPSRPREPVVVTTGHLIGDAADSAGNRILLIQARLLKGNSGGPVIDGDGSLVGVVVGRDAARPDLSAATPSEAIKGLLFANGVAPTPSVPKNRPSIDTANLLKAVSVLVQCTPARHTALAAPGVG